jgi:hypothetical protein
MAPAGRAAWFQLCQVPLGNGCPGYPNGDNVAAIAAWQPPNVWQTAAEPDLNAALDRIDAGMAGGSRYTDSRRGDAARWAGHILVEMFSVTEGQATMMLRTWLKTGVVFKESYYDKSQRKDRTGLCVDPTKRPGVRHA